MHDWMLLERNKETKPTAKNAMVISYEETGLKVIDECIVD